MESIQEKLFPSNRFRLVAFSPDAKEERTTVRLIRGHYTRVGDGIETLWGVRGGGRETQTVPDFVPTLCADGLLPVATVL